MKFSTSDTGIAFLAFWLVHSISVIASYTVWPNMETDCVKCCQTGNWLALISKCPHENLMKQEFRSCFLDLRLVRANEFTIYIQRALMEWLPRWFGDVIWRTGKKNFNAVSHNRARP